MAAKGSYKPEESIAVNYPEAVEWRRALHKCPQPSWLEFFATAFAAEKLSGWGYDVKQGRDVVAEDKLLLLPDAEKLQEEYDRALKAGANEKFLAPAKGGCTGVMATLKGDHPGPVIGFRFDLDSNEVTESQDRTHMPARQGFVSQNPGYAHMCGHDIHTATGLLLAKYFADNRKTLKGTVKMIFQPNEENLSGAAPMIEKGILDDLDYILGGHIGLSLKETGLITFQHSQFPCPLTISKSFSPVARRTPLQARSRGKMPCWPPVAPSRTSTRLPGTARAPRGSMWDTSRREAPGTSSRRRPTSAWRPAA